MIPVVVVTGFLGSGKTTLINQMLKCRPPAGPWSPADGELALIVNEFGDIGLDGHLLGDAKQVELPGGCVCCALDEDLQKTLLDLFASREKITGVLIETTGIAEPLPIAWSLESDELLNKVRLTAIVTTIDLENFLDHQMESPGVALQAEYADLLVFTKEEFVNSQKRLEVEKSLESINSLGIRLTGVHSGADVWRLLADPEVTFGEDRPSQDHKHIQHRETAWESTGIPIEKILDWERLEEELENLPRSYLRIKGFCRVVDRELGHEKPHWIAFHRVGPRVSKQRIESPPGAQLVAIGLNLREDVLRSCVERVRYERS